MTFKNTHIKAIIFDLNGTLVDDIPYHTQSWIRIAKEYFNKDYTAKEIRALTIGRNNTCIIDSLSDHPLTPEENNEISLKKESYYREECLKNPSFRLRDGTITLFKYLKVKHVPFTIASFSIKENMDFFIDQFKLYNYIDTNLIVYNESGCVSKKNLYLKAAKQLDIDPENILIFEDSESGIKGAVEAGCKNIVVLYNSSLREAYINYPEIQLVSSDFIEILYQLESKEIFK